MTQPATQEPRRPARREPLEAVEPPTFAAARAQARADGRPVHDLTETELPF